MRRQYLYGFSGLLGLSLICALFVTYEYGLFMVKNSELSAKVSSQLGYDLIRARIDFVSSGRSSMMGGGRIKFVVQGASGSDRAFLIEDAPTAPSFKLYREGYRFVVKTQPGAAPRPDRVIATLRQVIQKTRVYR